MSKLHCKDTLSNLVSVHKEFKKKIVGTKNIEYSTEVLMLKTTLHSLTYEMKKHTEVGNTYNLAMYYLWKLHRYKEYYRQMHNLFYFAENSIPNKLITIEDVKRYITEYLPFEGTIGLHFIKFWSEYHKVPLKELGLQKPTIKLIIEIC